MNKFNLKKRTSSEVLFLSITKLGFSVQYVRTDQVVVLRRFFKKAPQKLF
jgi:hypothetical protein